jgi:hypothetical protein
MNATYTDQPSVVELLLRRGANVRYSANDGMTAMSVAIKYRFVKEAKLLGEADKRKQGSVIAQ